MKFERRFYNSSIDFRNITKRRLITSIVIGVAAIIVIYSFFYVIRETTRLMSFGFEIKPNIITEPNRYLYNLFFAALSCIFGNTIAINFLLSRPQKIFSKRNIKRVRIMNDQVFLGFNFIYWFTKLWIMLAIFSMMVMDFQYLPYLFWPSVMLIIVLYLESWKTLSQTLRRNRWRIQFIHLFVISLLTVTLSFIDVIDYKSIDANLKKSRQFMDLPESDYADLEGYYYDKVVVKLQMNEDKKIQMWLNGRLTNDMYDISKEVHKRFDDEYYHLTHGYIVRIAADKDIPIKTIKEIELEIYDAGQFKIVYDIKNPDPLSLRFKNNEIEHRISPSLPEFLDEFDMPPRPDGWDYYKRLPITDTLKLKISDKLKANGKEISLDDLSDTIIKYIKPNVMVEYSYTDKTTYQQYISVLSVHKSVVRQLRLKDLKSGYTEDDLKYYVFSKEIQEEDKRLKRKFPMNITERF